ncbi:MAG: hypothetical protein AAB393_09020 [Bacteroidota bacterium]
MSRKHKKRKKRGFSGNPSSPKERLFKRITSYEFALQFSILVWNLSFFPPEEQADQTQRLIRQLAKDKPDEITAMIGMLLHRKAAYFSKYQRAIVDYTLSSVAGQRRLTVASADIRL